MKSIILKSLMVLSFALFMSFTGKAQTSYLITISNNTSCNLTVEIYDAGSNLIGTFVAPVLGTTTYNPPCGAGVPAIYKVYTSGNPACYMTGNVTSTGITCSSGNCCGCITGITANSNTVVRSGPIPLCQPNYYDINLILF